MALVEYHVIISFQSLLSGSHFGSLCYKTVALLNPNSWTTIEFDDVTILSDSGALVSTTC